MPLLVLYRLCSPIYKEFLFPDDGPPDISLTLLQVPSFSDVPLHECDRVRIGAPCCRIQYLEIHNDVTSSQTGYLPSACGFRHGCRFPPPHSHILGGIKLLPVQWSRRIRDCRCLGSERP